MRSTLPNRRVAWMCAMRTAWMASAAQPGHVQPLQQQHTRQQGGGR